MKIEKHSNNSDFEQIVRLIQDARNRTFRRINTELITLYYEIGKIVSEKVTVGNWGEKTVDELAVFIKAKNPELKGFTRRGLYRMKQFYETYAPASECFQIWTQTKKNKLPEIVSPPATQLQSQQNQQDTIVSALLTQISWSNHLQILSGAKQPEEKIFYLLLSAKEKYTKRELERQIDSSIYERTMLGNQKLSPVVREIHPDIENALRDKYVFEFLDLPETHSESDLQKALIVNFKKFILEIGKDFAYLGEGYRLQVGNEDFYLDLLFYNRSLQCLVNFELKIKKFKPEFLGKLNFYLEALDRDVKKEHENPSIGVLLCKGKDDTVVEYALARNVSPAVIADYEMNLPDKKLLKAKLDEFAQLIEQAENE